MTVSDESRVLESRVQVFSSMNCTTKEGVFHLLFEWQLCRYGNTVCHFFWLRVIFVVALQYLVVAALYSPTASELETRKPRTKANPKTANQPKSISPTISTTWTRCTLALSRLKLSVRIQHAPQDIHGDSELVSTT